MVLWPDEIRLCASNGELEKLSKECETDVLAVYETTDRGRFALHIENKLAGGGFTPNQPHLYKERLGQWKNRPKLGNYSDATSVLIAPQSFLDHHRFEAEPFESRISHEAIGEFLPVFRWMTS